MRGLIILVSIMSILIVIGIGFVIYGFIRDTPHVSYNAESPSIILPKNSIIKEMTAINDLLAIHVKSKNKDIIYFIDPKRGKIKSKIPIEYVK